jgi:superfamily I DNA/RNA helicase
VANFSVKKKEEADVDLSREDGLSRLKENPESNLGWRIVLETDQPDFGSKVIQKAVETGTHLREMLPTTFKKQILAETEKEKPTAPETNAEPVPANDKDVPVIKLVSFEGSKGLSAQHVFVVGVHEGELPRDVRRIKDLETCKFLVALTRTRKQCHILTAFRFSGVSKRPSIFVGWLPVSATRTVRVTKDTVATLS